MHAHCSSSFTDAERSGVAKAFWRECAALRRRHVRGTADDDGNPLPTPTAAVALGSRDVFGTAMGRAQAGRFRTTRWHDVTRLLSTVAKPWGAGSKGGLEVFAGDVKKSAGVPPTRFLIIATNQVNPLYCINVWSIPQEAQTNHSFMRSTPTLCRPSPCISWVDPPGKSSRPPGA